MTFCIYTTQKTWDLYCDWQGENYKSHARELPVKASGGGGFLNVTGQLFNPRWHKGSAALGRARKQDCEQMARNLLGAASYQSGCRGEPRHSHDIYVGAFDPQDWEG